MLTLHWIVFNADTESYPVYSMNSNGRELEQVVHTLRRSGWSDWPKGFDSLNLNPHSWIFYSVSVGASPLPTYSLPPQSEYLFRLHESVATELTFIWYMTLHFQGQPSAASLCFRICAEITLHASAKATCYSVNIALLLFWTLTAA